MTQHTPGPWKAYATPSKMWSIGTIAKSPTQESYELFRFPRYDNDQEVAANARLVAAAPELLEACIAMVRMFGETNPEKDWTATIQARAAIAKATNEE